MSESTLEMLETFDGSGRSTGVCPRPVVHRSGLWHRSVNVILFKRDERLIMQKRSRCKDVCPGVWDLSVAEHLQAGESFREAAYRGVREELSLSGIELVPFGQELRLRYEPAGLDIKDYEIQRLFLGFTEDEPKHDSHEVDAMRYARLDEAMAIRESAPATLTPWFCSWLGILADARFDCADWRAATRS